MPEHAAKGRPHSRHESDDASQAGRGRAIWSGTITFGLVSVPVDLFSAVRARQTSMKMVDTRGRALGRQYYCPKEDKALTANDIVRGYEMDDGKVVVVTDEELASVAPEMSRDIDLRRFVPVEQIPPTFYQRPYILAPSGKSTKAYHLLAQTMQRTGRAGVGTFVMRGNEYLVAILSDGALLRAETLRFPDELRSADDVGLPKRKKGSAKTVKQLSASIASLMQDGLDVDELSDRYSEEIHRIAEAKEKKGEDVVHPKGAADEDAEDAGADVVDLVKLLRQRLSASANVTTVDQAAGQATKGDRRPPHRAGSGKTASKRKPDTEGSSNADVDDLESLSKEALYDRAQKLDVPGRSKMSRQALISAIRKAA